MDDWSTLFLCVNLPSCWSYYDVQIWEDVWDPDLYDPDGAVLVIHCMKREVKTGRNPGLGGRRCWGTRPVGILQHWLDGSYGATCCPTSSRSFSSWMVGNSIPCNITTKPLGFISQVRRLSLNVLLWVQIRSLLCILVLIHGVMLLRNQRSIWL